MRNDLTETDGVVRSEHILNGIADLLDVPVLAFSEQRIDSEAARRLAHMGETALLSIVQHHLHRSDPEGRARFVEAVQRFVVANAS